MKYLYIDTSSSFLYTAIVEKNNLLASVSERFGQNLSAMALPRIKSMFDQLKIKPDDINKIIVVNGPGSFTGIRIGLTIAKVYAWSLNIPISVITSLEAMTTSSSSNKIHVPIINARRGYVYAAIYNGEECLLEPQHILFEELEKYLDKIDNYELISNDEFENITNTTPYTPDYIKIIEKYRNNENINPHLVNPNYLKLTQAEESKL